MQEITQETINEWKQKYGKVYRIRFEDMQIYFRSLTRDDYATLTQKAALDLRNFDHEYETFKTCVLNEIDEKIIEEKAGIVPVVAEQIMIKSGYQQVEAEEL